MNEPGETDARRIVSLVPSTTETLFALGVGDRVIGVTRFCVHPREARERRIVGGTKNPSIPRILSLEPDLVLANREENRKEDVERLRQKVRVEVAYPRNVPEAVEDIRRLGALVGASDRASLLARELLAAREEVNRGARPFRYLYFIWQRPYMVAGPDTFIDALLAEAGGENAAPGDRGRYPELGLDEIRSSKADVLLMSSEPFPFREEHRSRLAREIGEAARVLLVDGELLSWHGVRLREGLPYLSSLVAEIASGTSRH